MSENFSPGSGVDPEPPYTTVFLSQRDAGLQVPINFVTVPGVSLSAACFAKLRFEDDNSGDCLSNLLAVGFRRFVIDLYWDQGRQVWSFCPVSIPTSIQNTMPGATATLSFSAITLSSATSAYTPTPSSSSSLSHGTSKVAARQASSSAQSASTAASSASTTGLTSLGQITPSIAIVPDSSNDPVVSIGPYTCSTTINLSTFTSQFLDYIQKTETTLDAQILYVIINIHAAAADTSPLSPAPSPTNLPRTENLLGNLFSGNLSAYMYTSTNLRTDRENLGGSWYRVAERYRPVEDFYITTTNQYGVVSTDDGWPSESYIEFSQSKRLLLGYGTVDPQMANYNFSGDESIIFPNGYIQANQASAASSIGQLKDGCFLRNNTDILAQVNSSWATSMDIRGFNYPTTATSDIYPLLNLTANSTNCGISPLLNATLLNVTAHDDFRPYQNYTYSAIWSWAPGEPKNYISSSQASSDSLFRCATANIDLGGRWVVNDCSSKYFAACRAKNQPYNWTITTYQISYSYADQACGDSYDFAVPRTALENSYLNQAIRDSRRDYDGHGAWIDFNSLEEQGCWTSGGPNATCPYLLHDTQEDDLHKKYILVPTIAAIIVLIVTTMTIFVKVVGNRQITKRTKKRASKEVVFEGVPS